MKNWWSSHQHILLTLTRRRPCLYSIKYIIKLYFFHTELRTIVHLFHTALHLLHTELLYILSLLSYIRTQRGEEQHPLADEEVGGPVPTTAKKAWHSVYSRGLQRDVVYLGWPIAPLVFGPKCGGGGGGGVARSQPMTTAVHRSPNKLWRSNCIFNLWFTLWWAFSMRQRLCSCRTGQQEMRRRVGSIEPRAQTESCSLPMLPGNPTRCARHFIQGKLCIWNFLLSTLHCYPSHSHLC